MTVLPSGVRYPIQTVPVWAVNDYALGVADAAEQPPKLWAVRVDIPAYQAITHLMLAVTTKVNPSGVLRAGLYEESGDEVLPVGTTAGRDAYGAIGWQYSQFLAPIPARSAPRSAWLIFNHGAVNSGFMVVRPYMRDERLMAGDCYSTSALDELPASFTPGDGRWQPEHRIPLLGLTAVGPGETPT